LGGGSKPGGAGCAEDVCGHRGTAFGPWALQLGRDLPHPRSSLTPPSSHATQHPQPWPNCAAAQGPSPHPHAQPLLNPEDDLPPRA
jgi:hypothetical protein